MTDDNTAAESGGNGSGTPDAAPSAPPPFAALSDVTALFRSLTPEETTRTEALLPLVSDLIREAAHNLGRDFDWMIACRPGLASVAKIVTVDVVSRVLRQNTTGEPASSEMQSGLGFQHQISYAFPGGGMGAALMNNDLKRLGLTCQRLGGFDPFGAPWR